MNDHWMGKRATIYDPQARFDFESGNTGYTPSYNLARTQSGLSVVDGDTSRQVASLHASRDQTEAGRTTV